MATANFTVSLRDLITPVLEDIAAGVAAIPSVGAEVWRRLGEAERELAHRRWEDEWFSLTRVPWRLTAGWAMPAQLRVRLHRRHPMLSTIDIEGTRLCLPSMEITVDATPSESVLRLAIPMELVDMAVVP